MDRRQYFQNILESRTTMTNMLHIMTEQERTMAHLLGVPPRTNTSNELLQRILTQVAAPTPVASHANSPPTPAEIQAATRTIIYGEIENPINSECPISHETFENNDEVIQIRHCGHIFHRNGINQWFRTGYQCPVCRHDIRGARAGSGAGAAAQDNVLFEYLFTYPMR